MTSLSASGPRFFFVLAIGSQDMVGLRPLSDRLASVGAAFAVALEMVPMTGVEPAIPSQEARVQTGCVYQFRHMGTGLSDPPQEGLRTMRPGLC